MAFVTPIVEHWLEWEIAQWVHHERSINQFNKDSGMFYPVSVMVHIKIPLDISHFSQYFKNPKATFCVIFFPHKLKFSKTSLCFTNHMLMIILINILQISDKRLNQG